MLEPAYRAKLTTYTGFTLRKCPPRDPKKEGRGTWARAEIIEEIWAQEDIIKQIRKLSESPRSVAAKKLALMPNQRGQIITLVDNLTSLERDEAFEWSLAQLDSVVKPVRISKGTRKHQMYETVTMVAFLRRAPRKDLNAAIISKDIEKKKTDKLRQHNTPPQSQPRDHEPIRTDEADRDKYNHDNGSESYQNRSSIASRTPMDQGQIYNPTRVVGSSPLDWIPPQPWR